MISKGKSIKTGENMNDNVPYNMSRKKRGGLGVLVASVIGLNAVVGLVLTLGSVIVFLVEFAAGFYGYFVVLLMLITQGKIGG